jgi:membrane-associated phospholipid phosphatase
MAGFFYGRNNKELQMRRYIDSGKKRIGAIIALLSFELVTVLLLFFLSIIGFAYLVNRVIRLKETNFDMSVFTFIRPYISEAMTSFMVFITFLGTHKFLIPANLILIAYFLFIKKHRWYSIKVPVVAIGSVSIMLGLKTLFSRVRPTDPLLAEVKGFSFPSGHAMSAMTFYGLILYLVYRYIKHPVLKWSLIVLLSLLIVLIGLSRVYLRVHYPSDVIAGFSMGLIWLVIALWSTKRIEKMVRKDPGLNEPLSDPLSSPEKI